ncbi:glycosyltransferase family 2 protein [Mangrovimonas aestuarii]|uniref:glycosyltransferase family 2 protein n=1 Tax=Mangrovimonas aestuarii TaxID=3018443 RepID=UPI0023797E7C|nr:glycosyltransferase family 2 protein [Mangrovimonas aestuarii]
MSKEKPLVSICIPTFNGERFINEAMDSAISQSYSNLEIVVSDDASTDRTLIILEGFKEKTTIPIYIYKHQPSGIGANWNHCVQKANGSYIKFLFQDDVLLPSCIEQMMAVAGFNPRVGLVYSKRGFIYSELTPKITSFIEYYRELHRYWESVGVKEGVLKGTDYLKDRQLLSSPKNKIGEPTNVLLKTDCFKTIGYFNETLKQGLDHEYWYRVMTKYNIGFVNKPLAKFRLHNNQASHVNKSGGLNETDVIYKSYYINLFRYLHSKNKWKLLKLYHPILSKLVKLKQNYAGG